MHTQVCSVHCRDPGALNTLLDSMRLCIANKQTSRIFLVLGCHGDDIDAWQRPYLGEIAHYKVNWCAAPAPACPRGLAMQHTDCCSRPALLCSQLLKCRPAHAKVQCWRHAGAALEIAIMLIHDTVAG